MKVSSKIMTKTKGTLIQTKTIIIFPNYSFYTADMVSAVHLRKCRGYLVRSLHSKKKGILPNPEKKVSDI
jgi:hypothetical protein